MESTSANDSATQPRQDDDRDLFGPVPATPAPGATPSGFLTKDQILSKSDIVYEEFDVPEWGGKIMVKSLNGRERSAWQQSMVKGAGPNAQLDFQAMNLGLLRIGVVDPVTHQRLFTESDLKALSMKSNAAIERVGAKIMALSGIGEDEVASLGKLAGMDLGDSGS